MLFFEIGYCLFCIFLAAVNSDLINSGKRIYHAINGGIHIAAAFAIGYFWWWPLSLALLCNTRLFFDYALNLIRGLPLAYVSPAPKSWTDKAEKKLFGTDAYTPKIILLLVSFAINAVYFIFIRK